MECTVEIAHVPSVSDECSRPGHAAKYSKLSVVAIGLPPVIVHARTPVLSSDISWFKFVSPPTHSNPTFHWRQTHGGFPVRMRWRFRALSLVRRVTRELSLGFSYNATFRNGNIATTVAEAPIAVDARIYPDVLDALGIVES